MSFALLSMDKTKTISAVELLQNSWTKQYLLESSLTHDVFCTERLKLTNGRY